MPANPTHRFGLLLAAVALALPVSSVVADGFTRTVQVPAYRVVGYMHPVQAWWRDYPYRMHNWNYQEPRYQHQAVPVIVGERLPVTIQQAAPYPAPVIINVNPWALQ